VTHCTANIQIGENAKTAGGELKVRLGYLCDSGAWWAKDGM